MSELGGLTTEILGFSSEAAAIRSFVGQAAESEMPVTLLGEPGSGKQLAALSIHDLSSRSAAPFLMIDCSLYYERELKRELFGYGGAGASGKASRKGMLEFASRGTCYLSHIEELTPALQASLSKFLDGGRFRRLGDGKEVSSGVHLIVSSEKNLDGFVQAGLFDGTLYTQLSAARKRLSPLRERREDIPVLVDRLRAAFAERRGLTAPVTFLPETLLALESYPWPLNFDELKKEVTRVLECGRQQVTPENLAMEIASYWLGQGGDPDVRRVMEELDAYIREFRIMSQLQGEFGDILEVLVPDEGGGRSCYRGLI